MIVYIWDFNKKEYKEGSISDSWRCPLFTDDMEEIVNCASCGDKMHFGDGYTSRRIHTKTGMGYTVCEDCYRKEFEAEGRRW